MSKHDLKKIRRKTVERTVNLEDLEPRNLLAADVVISEFLASNQSSLVDGFGESSDWIELHNRGDEIANLSGFHLTDDAANLSKWTFPSNVTLGVDEYMILFASGRDLSIPDSNGHFHADFKLSADGEYVALTDNTSPRPVVLSEYGQEGVDYVPQRSNISYGGNGYMLTPTPAAPNSGGVQGFVEEAIFSAERGYYASPFAVDVASPTVGATLVYTTDGSVPTLDNGRQVFAGQELAPKTRLRVIRNSTLRVAGFKSGFQSSKVSTHTYLFVEDVIDQPGMHRNVTRNATWGPLIGESLLSVPTISLVTPNDISQRERATSVEFINPDGTQGFQIDAGVEHYGGHSLNSTKKNMRLSFKSIYGDSKLNYNLFDDANATDEFDQFLLRTGSHDNWFWTHPAGQGGVYFRNQWAFERQLEMGHLAPRGRYVQVFINGKYEGLHNLMERPNSDFMSSYLGGSDEDYDALNAGAAIDGDKAAWNSMVAAINARDWNRLQQYMDVENYVDYMLLEFYSGNDWDWNHSQNWAAATQRTGGDGYMFFAWDSDVKLRTTPTANVVNRGGPGDLWAKISRIPEFRLLLADRVQKHFFHNGLFTPDQVNQQIAALADATELPVIAETARWSSRYTPDTWRGYVDWIQDRFVPNRTRRVLSQLSSFLPAVSAPTYTVDGTPQHGGSFPSAAILSMTSSSGSIYYTTDESDPRGADGQPVGTLLETEIVIDIATTIKSRVFVDGEWSALSEATFKPAIRGDVNQDGAVNSTDIDAIYLAIASGAMDSVFDLNQDGSVTRLDADELVQDILNTRRGDVDLDGKVVFTDFLQLSASFGQSGATWSDGDTNGDGEVTFSDFLALSANFGFDVLDPEKLA